MKMVKIIVEKAFEKAKNFGIEDNKSSLSKHIVDELDKTFKVDERTMIRVYDYYILKTGKIKASKNTIDVLCKYLGYKNYTDFVKKNTNVELNPEIHPIKKEKITKVEVTNLDQIKSELSNNRINLLFLIIVIISFLIIVFIIRYNTITSEKTIVPNQITINNFNTNTKYYYYITPKGKVELTENAQIKNAKPLTYEVLNIYFKENKIDTSSQKVKLIKTQYYDNGWKDKHLLKSTNNDIKDLHSKKIINKPKIKLTNQQSLKSKTLNISIKNENEIDILIEKKIIQKFKKTYSIINSLNSTYRLIGQSKYTFSKSKITKKRIICSLQLNYKIINKKSNQIIFTDILQIKGTGFSKNSAKQNTINKLKL